jgi:hypothetical protein
VEIGTRKDEERLHQEPHHATISFGEGVNLPNMREFTSHGTIEKGDYVFIITLASAASNPALGPSLAVRWIEQYKLAELGTRVWTMV